VIAQGHTGIRKVTISTGDVNALPNAYTGNSGGITVDPSNTFLYVAGNSNSPIYKYDLSAGVVTTVAGAGKQGFADGTASAAQFRLPYGVAR